MTSEPAAARAPVGIRIDANDFELFELPVRFAQDRAAIDARWKALQRQVHPDRFVTEGGAAQRVAVQSAIRVNEAYERLKSPLARAAYLCQLHGETTSAETRGAMPAAFLVQQMTWRGTLEQATALSTVDVLGAEVDACRRTLQDGLATLLDDERDWAAAAMQIKALMFVERLARDIEGRRDSLNE